VNKVDPDAAGINPLWRKTLVHVVWLEYWTEGTSSADIQKKRNNLKKGLAAASKLVPEVGSYLNEVS
jgi:hypothetical protein